jgi:hypothetical protein
LRSGANQLSTVGVRKDHINRQNKKEKCWSGSSDSTNHGIILKGRQLNSTQSIGKRLSGILFPTEQ